MMGENGLLKSMARPESVIAVLNGAMCVVELAHPRTSYANLRRVVRPTRMRVLVLLLVSLPLSAQSITADQWRTDLAVLVKELPTRMSMRSLTSRNRTLRRRFGNLMRRSQVFRSRKSAPDFCG